MTVEYAENFDVIRKEVPRRGMWGFLPGQSASGYGKKISTDWMIQFKGDWRKYRVYCICYSNAGSYYIIKRGEMLFIRSTDLED